MEKELQVLFKEFVAECRYSACLSAETIKGYEYVFKLFQKIMPEVTEPESLIESTLTRFFERIQTRMRVVGKDTLRQGVKKSTIKTQWTKLNVFFKWLEKKGYLDKNPLSGIKPPRVSYDDFRRLEDNEINKIYAGIVVHSKSPFMRLRGKLTQKLC